MVAALVTLIASSTAAPGLLAAYPTLPGSPAADEALPGSRLATSPLLPAASRSAVTFAAAVPDRGARVPLPAVPVDPRRLDRVTSAPEPEPASAGPVASATATVETRPARPPVVRAAARPARLWAQLRRGLTVSGVATWYWGSRGYAGVAHVAMPGARFLPRGKDGVPRARVCAAGRCVVVRVVDRCGCYARTPRARVADLSLGTLRRLRLDPGRGVYKVRVTLIQP